VTVPHNWHPEQYESKQRRHLDRNADRAAAFLVGQIVSSFGGSGATGGRSGATYAGRQSDRSKPGEPPHVQTGMLKRSIRWVRTGTGSRRVGSSLKPQEGQSHSVALMMEYGTRPHTIVPVNAKVLANRKLGVVFGKRVQHPGTDERPYLRPALLNNRIRLRQMLGAGKV
jgi:hypothetical protein